ncbi:spore maturation protein [Microaerobacter geothermalis]|nr:spore maturation protein [Microaerobacter geothermalis]
MNVFTAISQWAIPLFIFFTITISQFRGVKVFETFVEGAKEGIFLSIKLIPYILGVYVAFGILKESGALIFLLSFLSPIYQLLGIPVEIFPLMIVRPLSGPASLGITMDLLETYGPDSFIGRMASTIDGSTDTTLYIMTLYFGAVGVKNIRYALIVGLSADVMAFLSSVFFVKLIFGG